MAANAGQQDAAPQDPNIDPNAPFSMGQAAVLFDTIMRRSDQRLEPLLHQIADMQQDMHVLAQAQHNPQAPQDPVATAKRKHEDITNEALRKQYEPLEEMTIRINAVSEVLSDASTNQKAITPEEALRLQKTLDEGKQFTSRRLKHLEVAIAEGWEVAKQMEKNAFMMELDEDMQKQLKRARKDAKAAEAEKKEKKHHNGHANRRGYFFRRGRGGFRGGFGGGGGFRGGFQGGFGGGQRGGPRACYTCGQVGHLSAYCPQRGAQAAAGGRVMA
jgi:plasmid maintenance system antidote protein VapI